MLALGKTHLSAGAYSRGLTRVSQVQKRVEVGSVDVAGSNRKSAAEKFIQSMVASNEYHAQYLNDADFYDAYDQFTRWQLEYLLPFFEDLMAIEGYADAIDFVMSDLAGVGVSERDRDIQRAARVISATLPEQAAAKHRPFLHDAAQGMRGGIEDVSLVA